MTAAAATITTMTTASDQLFYCHECAANVVTSVDQESSEVCCNQCGSNFVEEIEHDDPPAEFHNTTETTTAPRPTSSTATVTSAVNNDQDALDEYFSEFQESLRTADRTRSNEQPHERPTTTNASTNNNPNNATTGTPIPSFGELVQQLLAGGPGRSGRIVTSSGNPVEIYVSDGGDAIADGLFGALGGPFGLPFPSSLASNPGDYAFGNMANIINQLMQQDPNRHGAPPAAKEVVERLPKIKISQAQVDAKIECAVCKDLFAVDDNAQQLPCTHAFHPDCILPWLKQHNSCPVCRHELPTDDPEYEARRQRAASSTTTH